MRLDGQWKRKGMQPLFSLQETALVLGSAAGMGRNQALVREDLRTAAHKIGRQMERAHTLALQQGKHVSEADMKRAQVYQNATISRQTYQDMKKRVNVSGVLGRCRHVSCP